MELGPQLREVVRRKVGERRKLIRELEAVEALVRRELPAFVVARKRLRSLRKAGKVEETNRAKAEFGPLAGRVCGLLAKAQRLREQLKAAKP